MSGRACWGRVPCIWFVRVFVRAGGGGRAPFCCVFRRIRLHAGRNLLRTVQILSMVKEIHSSSVLTPSPRIENEETPSTGARRHCWHWLWASWVRAAQAAHIDPKPAQPTEEPKANVNCFEMYGEYGRNAMNSWQWAECTGLITKDQVAELYNIDEWSRRMRS